MIDMPVKRRTLAIWAASLFAIEVLVAIVNQT